MFPPTILIVGFHNAITMTLEELTKALGLDTDENKDKAGILKKEFNAKLKDINEKTKEIESFKEAEKVAKQNADRLEIVTKAYNLDFNAKDVDAMIEESKDKLIKAAGVNDKNSEEFKATKNELTKARREITRIKEENSQLSEQLTAEKNQRINTTKRNMIHKALVNNNAIKPDMFVDMFVDKVIVDNDGKTMNMKDAVGNDISIEDAISDWAKDNPELIKQNVTGGMNTGSNGNSGDNNNGGVSDFMKSIINSGNNTSNGTGQSLAELFG